jgi:hypothetical protein
MFIFDFNIAKLSILLRQRPCIKKVKQRARKRDVAVAELRPALPWVSKPRA